MKEDISTIVRPGSRARGDFSEALDIDIALLMNYDRMESKKYNNILAKISTEIAMK